MQQAHRERRRFLRYNTEVEVYFQITYDVKTKVKFQLLDRMKHTFMKRKHQAVSRNVSAEGLSFVSKKELLSGDVLRLEVYLPEQKDPILMEGEVMWSQTINPFAKEKSEFETGVKLLKVNGKTVHDTVYFDESNHITWSIVLESILGNFRKFIQKKRTDEGA